MNVIIRTDASTEIGTGHLMRCLSLAQALSEQGGKVTFICRELSGNLCGWVETKGFEVVRLPETTAQAGEVLGLIPNWETDVAQTKAIISERRQEIDWLIVDHYGLDNRWESQLRPYVKRIMAIDDLANRCHDCDLLLDQNFFENLETRYDRLVPSHCQKLLGPKYALLRPEFREVRRHLRQREGVVKRILVFLGGSDPTNETVKALKAIPLLNRPDIAVDVVVGASNPYQEQVRQLCSVNPNTTFYCQVENMAQLMANADLAVASGGTTTWERCFLGLPTITLAIAQNQVETTAAVAATGATWYLGQCTEVSLQDLANAIRKALNNPSLLQEMADNAMKLMGSNCLAGDETPIVNVLIEAINATAARLPT